MTTAKYLINKEKNCLLISGLPTVFQISGLKMME
jgi:hypothetical protein